MEVRHATAPDQIPGATTDWLRGRFLAEQLFVPGEVRLLYSHEDRIVVGGALPEDGPLTLHSPDPLRSEYFLERRELGVVNVGEAGTVTVDGTPYPLAHRECLYVGTGGPRGALRGRRVLPGLHPRARRPSRRPGQGWRTPSPYGWAARRGPTTGRSTSTSTPRASRAASSCSA